MQNAKLYRSDQISKFRITDNLLTNCNLSANINNTLNIKQITTNLMLYQTLKCAISYMGVR